jgi:hypothetical protein
MSDFSDSAARRHAYDFYIKLPLSTNSGQNYRIRLRRFLTHLFLAEFLRPAKFNQLFTITNRRAIAGRAYIQSRAVGIIRRLSFICENAFSRYFFNHERRRGGRIKSAPIDVS